MNNEVIELTKRDIILDITNIPDAMIRTYQDSVQSYKLNLTATLLNISKSISDYYDEMYIKDSNHGYISFRYNSSDDLFSKAFRNYEKSYNIGNLEKMEFTLKSLSENGIDDIKLYNIKPTNKIKTTTYLTELCKLEFWFECCK